MDISPKLKNSIKVFASEAGRFKLEDLANIVGVDKKNIVDILNSLVIIGELEGSFANKNSEFVTNNKLKQEVQMILENPNLIETYNSDNVKEIDNEREKNNVISTITEIKKCPKCNISVEIGGKFCPQCGEPIG